MPTMKRNFFVLLLYALMLSLVMLNIRRFETPLSLPAKPSLHFNITETQSNVSADLDAENSTHIQIENSSDTKNHTRSNHDEASSPDSTHEEASSPDLCIVVSFRGTSGDDHYLKTMAHKNSATVYSALGPRVRAFLALVSADENVSDWEVLKSAPETNEHGTPLFSSLLNLVADACPDAPLLAYANSDILFDSGLLPTIDALLDWNQPEMLAVGRRSNHDLKGPLSLDDVPKVPSELFIDIAQDYFIVTRGLLDRWSSSLPGYVIGRRAYDNALVDWAYHRSVLVDLTATVTALHQTTADGNYAGHSRLNRDAEYNVQLPGAEFDHGSTNHAAYETALHGSQVVVRRRSDNTVVAQSKHNAVPLQLTSRGRPVAYEALRSPLFVTFGNHAYKEMLASFLCNLQLFPPMLAHTLVMVTDQATVDYLSALDTDAIIGLHSDSVQSGHDYNTPEYIRLMLLRGRLLTQLIGPERVVIWLEADAEYCGNLLKHDQILHSTTDLTLYWDGTMYGGGFIRFAATEAARAFYANAVVSRLEAEIAKGAFGTNDQDLLNQGLGAVRFSEFDRCAFRTGMFYHPLHSAAHQARCKGTRPMVQQHNWVSGNANKIQMAKDHGAWFLDGSTCKRRDLRAVVMTMDRPHSLERLLLSLKGAAYPADARIDVQVSVDRRSKDQPHDPATMALLQAFEWPHGVFEIQAWPEPVGIFGQWVDSWPCELFPPALYDAVVLLEDDLEVSPRYHEWFIDAHKAYAAPDIGAVTGMRAQLVARQGARLTVDQLVPKGIGVFAYRLIATWSVFLFVCHICCNFNNSICASQEHVPDARCVAALSRVGETGLWNGSDGRRDRARRMVPPIPGRRTGGFDVGDLAASFHARSRPVHAVSVDRRWRQDHRLQLARARIALRLWRQGLSSGRRSACRPSHAHLCAVRRLGTRAALLR